MKRTLMVVLSIVLGLSLFSGCSPASVESGEESPSVQASENATEETVDDGRMDYVKYVLPRSIEALDEADVWSAVYLGYFEEEDIDLIVEMAISQNAIKMVASGQADICIPNPAQLLTAQQADMDLVSVFQLNVNNIYGVAVRADSGIETWADLEGKTMAVPSSTSYTTMNPILISAGVDPSTVTYVPVADQRAAMLNSGEVDAAYTWQKEWQQWQAQGIDLKFLDANEVLENCGNSVCVTPEFLESNRDLLVRFLRAMSKGLYFAKCNPEAAAAIVVARFPSLGLTAEQAYPAIQGLVNITNDENTETNGYGYYDMDRWQTCLEWAIQMEQVSEDNPIELTSFLTNELLEEVNNFDRSEVEEDAANFDVTTIQW